VPGAVARCVAAAADLSAMLGYRAAPGTAGPGIPDFDPARKEGAA
jgi:hypothetical protein